MPHRAQSKKLEGSSKVVISPVLCALYYSLWPVRWSGTRQHETAARRGECEARPIQLSSSEFLILSINLPKESGLVKRSRALLPKKNSIPCTVQQSRTMEPCSSQQLAPPPHCKRDGFCDPAVHSILLSPPAFLFTIRPTIARPCLTVHVGFCYGGQKSICFLKLVHPGLDSGFLLVDRLFLGRLPRGSLCLLVLRRGLRGLPTSHL